MEYRISADGAGQRLDKFLRKVLPDLPLSAIYKLIRTKKARVNAVRAEEGQLLQPGDVVTIREQALQARPVADKPATPKVVKREFGILHEDQHILVVDKPSGLAIHPGSGVSGPTLVDQVRAYVGEVPEGEFKAAPAHRLDRETSGVVVVAKTRQAIVRLAEIFTEGETTKQYVTLVQGRIDRTGEIDIPLAEHQQTAASKAERGVNMQSAFTRWTLLAQAADAALAEVEIETGRTHQIRRHFAAIGHPVAGDTKHGDFPFNRYMTKQWDLRRMFLHAARLGIPHPVTGQKMTFRSALAPELVEVCRRMGLALPPKYGGR